jgi:large subunit ribosomal protein L6
MPLTLPAGVKVAISQEEIQVTGVLGALVRPANHLVKIHGSADRLEFTPADGSTAADAMSGTMRALVSNMVNGVSKGFEKKLNLVGVGFRAQAAGSKLNLQIGFSHPVSKEMPDGVKVDCPTQTEIVKSSFPSFKTSAAGTVMWLPSPSNVACFAASLTP